MADGLVLENPRITQGSGAQARVLIDLPSIAVAPGAVLTIMGPSGSGKSTLLSWIIGTLARDFTASGRVLVDGRDVTRLAPDRRRIGILFQDDLLFPHLSVAENLSFGLAAQVRGRAARSAEVDRALAQIGLDGFGPRDPATLSGGQKARVALMRMLLSQPRALLLDEPFSRLDTELRAQIRTLVVDRARESRLPVVMVTHDAEDAAAVGGQIIRL